MQRAAVVRIYDVGETTVIVAPDGRVHELSGASAELARELLLVACEPCTRAALLAHVEQLTGAPLDAAELAVVEQLLALLESAKILVAAPDHPPRVSSAPHTRLVLALSGAIACAEAPGLIALLQRRGFELRVIATEAALRFVQAEAIEALVHQRVLSSMWPAHGELPVPHINLAQWADAVLVWPASATTISRLATGDYGNLVSAVALTCRAPVVVVPSMNVEMYASAAVQRNLRQLIEDGLHVLAPGSGRELADAPAQRRVALGPTPPHEVVVQLLETALRIARARRTHLREGPPRDADEWDAYFRSHADHELAWHCDELDEDIMAVLTHELEPVFEPGGGSLDSRGSRGVLDIGTGLGVAAIAAAKLGARVVATDLSATALARAHARAGALPITWLRDDITQSCVHGSFEVVLDRGCLHLLAPEQARAYADTLARLCAPGGVVVIKTHALVEGSSRATTPYDAEAITTLLGDAFTLESDTASELPGPAAIAELVPKARLFVLRRRAVGEREAPEPGHNLARDA